MNRVRNLRKEKGLTQRKLSMDIHVSQQYISKVENGESSMTEEVILRLSKYFHVSIAYLLGVTEDRFSELVEENRDPDLREWLEFYYRLNKENQDTITYLSKHLLEKQSTEE
ncbi:MAG: helix-turn-helix transcriptional regulator [Lachnospiraceae bacterium]|nr:helix-turn-helix transcriptional regulator [Lachnospiraceae bacterium]